MVEFEGPVPNGGGPITGSYTDIPGSSKFGYKSNSFNRVNQAGLSFTLEPSAFLDLNGGGIRSLGEYLRFALKPNVDQIKILQLLHSLITLGFIVVLLLIMLGQLMVL